MSGKLHCFRTFLRQLILQRIHTPVSAVFRFYNQYIMYISKGVHPNSYDRVNYRNRACTIIMISVCIVLAVIAVVFLRFRGGMRIKPSFDIAPDTDIICYRQDDPKWADDRAAKTGLSDRFRKKFKGNGRCYRWPEEKSGLLAGCGKNKPDGGYMESGLVEKRKSLVPLFISILCYRISFPITSPGSRLLP